MAGMIRTKEEALQRIKELEAYIKNIDDEVGFEGDEIFLLSVEEYEKYKDIITVIDAWWWLRSPSTYNENCSTFVFCDVGRYCNVLSKHGVGVDFESCRVRPALKIHDDEFSDIAIGGLYVKYAFPWIKLDDDIAISEVPIGTHEFDSVSNDYANSEIRKYLQEWKDNRK